MRGTWQTTDSGGAAGPLIAAGAAVAVLAFLATVLWILAVAVGVALAVAVGAVVLLRRGNPADAELLAARLDALHRESRRELPGPERAALEPPAPREVHQHVHFHVGAGADPRAVAEIARQLGKEPS